MIVSKEKEEKKSIFHVLRIDPIVESSANYCYNYGENTENAFTKNQISVIDRQSLKPHNYP